MIFTRDLQPISRVASQSFCSVQLLISQAENLNSYGTRAGSYTQDGAILHMSFSVTRKLVARYDSSLKPKHFFRFYNQKNYSQCASVRILSNTNNISTPAR